ncbi:flagellin [Selenomonas sp.]|uniref:flagellin n=1 Tax=Selenomonas sp. TaxID=2053611 RepID=UPI002A74C46B|nr:flagellin [Selenomonas sp.]MDY3298075.1 flagellin [Selenomonas sp.]
MAMVVKNNMSAKNTLNQLDKNNKAAAKDLKKLASGQKINSAGDDASGLSISERMEVQVRSLDQDNQNAQNGSSLLKTAEGALQSTVDILRTLKEKVINAANDTNTDADRATIQKELNQSVDQIEENASVTYNGKRMLDGSQNSTVLDPGTYTTYANESLLSGTSATKTRLTKLQERNGNSLGIQIGDTLTLTYVKNGETSSNSITVKKNSTLSSVFASWSMSDIMGVTANPKDPSYIGVDQYGETVHTQDGGDAVVYRAKEVGLKGQISGMTFQVTRSDGTVNKTASAKLDEFKEVVRAQDPSPDNSMNFQVGTRSNQTVRMGFTDMRATALGLRTTDGKTLNIGTQENARTAINVLDNALQKALDEQTKIGAVTSRLGYTSSNIVLSSENTQASMSVIRDADMAAEMTSYTKDNVLQQAAQSMLAQANQSSSGVLSLLQCG